VISTADRNALPWWLRYSMALLETNRGEHDIVNSDLQHFQCHILIILYFFF
jgi:hypothetical protein